MEKVLENIVLMVKQHPDGIPLKKLGVFYNKTYHKNLTLSDLGFKSSADLVASLGQDLFVDGKLVVHKIHQPVRKSADGVSAGAELDTKLTNPLATGLPPGDRSSTPIGTVPQEEVTPNSLPLTQTGISFLGPPLTSTTSLFSTFFSPVNSLFDVPKPAEKLTQQQLYQRVLEVS